MRIVFLSHYFYPNIGGVEKHVLNLSIQLIKQGHQVTVITSQNKLNLPLRQTYRKIKIIRIKLSTTNWQQPNKWQIWNWIMRNKNILQNAEIIHCHDVFFWYLPLKLINPHKKVYTTFHGYEGHIPPQKKSIIVRKITEKLCTGNICIGKYITKWYSTNPDKISYGGVNIPKQTIPYKNKYSAAFIGRLNLDTGLPIYLKAAKILTHKQQDFKIGFYGQGPLKKKIMTSGKYHGVIKNPHIAFEKHHFAFVSGYLTILEAMANQRLVFSVYDNDLKKDYLTLTPFNKLINIANTPHNLVNQINYYLSNPLQEKKKVDLAYKWVKKQTWEKLCNQYHQLWKK